MLSNWSPGDWIAFAALAVTVLVAILGGIMFALKTAKSIGAAENEARHIKDEVALLTQKAEAHEGTASKVGVLETEVADLKVAAKEAREMRQAIALIGQSMATISLGMGEMRAETREALAQMKAETSQAFTEVRHDVRNLMTGKTVPARRADGSHG